MPLMKYSEIEEPRLFLLGIELLDDAGLTIYQTLERQLKPLFGEDWFAKTLVRNPEDKELAPRDLSTLLVQIEIRNNQSFRLAIQKEYNAGRPLIKTDFENYRDLRITRNEWFHRTISPITTDELSDLISTILKIFPTTTLISQKSLRLNTVLKEENFSMDKLLKASSYVGAYVTKLDEIQESIKKEDEITEILLAAHEVYQTEIMDQIIKEELEKEEQSRFFRHSVGSPYTGSLLPQKYTLKLDGSIIDRREGLELSEKLGTKALEIGRQLLKQHPTGGRLRLSADGTVVGYQDEEWVVIGSIDLQNWFAI
jgi:hypothetical protein